MVSSVSEKKSKGRQKIEIRPISKQSSRHVTFSKRRAGLFKKAEELSLLCGSHVALICFSPGNKPVSFGSPSVQAVVDRYLSCHVPSPQDATSAQWTARLESSRKEKEMLQSLESVLDNQIRAQFCGLEWAEKEKEWLELVSSFLKVQISSNLDQVDVMSQLGQGGELTDIIGSSSHSIMCSNDFSSLGNIVTDNIEELFDSVETESVESFDLESNRLVDVESLLSFDFRSIWSNGQQTDSNSIGSSEGSIEIIDIEDDDDIQMNPFYKQSELMESSSNSSCMEESCDIDWSDYFSFSDFC